MCVLLPSHKHSLSIASNFRCCCYATFSRWFLKIALISLSVPFPFPSRFSLSYACGTSQLTFLKFKITEIPHWPTFCSALKRLWHFQNSFYLHISPLPFSPFCPFTADHSGTRDDREPLANAIKSDSAVIGGNRKHEWALLWFLALGMVDLSPSRNSFSVRYWSCGPWGWLIIPPGLS